MIVTVSVSSIELSPGSTVTIPNLSWQEFELLLKELGENRTNRIAYYNGTLEIMSPLVLHERPNRIITDIVKAILDSQGRDWEDFGSTTFTRPEVAGVEPDTCLYVQNALSVRGCTHMDLDVYPPPDLAVESDLTSVTTVSAYTALRVPEVWIYKNNQLKIHIFENGSYTESSTSLIFPELPINVLIPTLVQKAINEGTSKMLRELKTQILRGL